jgi:hypothetical protein
MCFRLGHFARIFVCALVRKCGPQLLDQCGVASALPQGTIGIVFWVTTSNKILADEGVLSSPSPSLASSPWHCDH